MAVFAGFGVNFYEIKFAKTKFQKSCGKFALKTFFLIKNLVCPKF
jgi:hypothetical protein